MKKGYLTINYTKIYWDGSQQSKYFEATHKKVTHFPYTHTQKYHRDDLFTISIFSHPIQFRGYSKSYSCEIYFLLLLFFWMGCNME